MEYKVEMTARATRNVRAIYRRVDAANSLPAAVWYRGLRDTIFSLDHSPERGTRTEETAALRQILYGNKPHMYRIIYSIEHVSKRVLVLHIRHGAQNAFQPRDVWKPNI